jgi:hypothetical protein
VDLCGGARRAPRLILCAKARLLCAKARRERVGVLLELRQQLEELKVLLRLRADYYNAVGDPSWSRSGPSQWSR